MQSETRVDEAQQPAETVSVVHPVKTEMTRYLEETGTAEALRKVTLVAQVSGTLKSINYEDGTRVEKRCPLFVIDPAEYQANLEKAEGEVAQSEASLINAQTAYKRASCLSKSAAVSKAEIDEALANRDIAQGQLASSKAALELARIDVEHTQITAPFSGYVTAHKQDVGALITTSTELAIIMNLDPIYVNFTVPESEALRMRRAMKGRGEAFRSLKASEGGGRHAQRSGLSAVRHDRLC
ncbi:efflux RND transporter periplasmic adaptor subunit [Breoghania sp.]|uniref:efflux RND transporter periplasmic adaptor subunit n=1 Tax=Breoghania sp. TaxID=2065378 RepID=UPI00262CAF19|nr:efflux RND transporter periplasmic adaptor subunit [Breoghania sp.]MDJ0931003.1 efflux RND transporter periplasmic adaptor subunit [Breoghania sp.]